ncbi:MAG: ATP phosphoribosyltransferase regulatory subunit [Lachnospiraceae bacterium]|nr:ATP phosphoribosyltransferase regulatory subunit [Lachnospiraceae bacterium]
MIQKILHTPEGVRDIYNEECERKLALEEHLRQVLNSYGYRDIETPTFEFFDVYSREVGTIPSRELYKFFDREGNTLVLRPDFTPSIARAASKYFMKEKLPVRLCYLGNTFVNNSSYQGRLKENTQLGAELIGDTTPEADAEILAMAVECLQKAGLRDFQISVGHVQFFASLAREAGLDEATEEELKMLIRNKNNFGVEQLLSEENISARLKEIFVSLPSLFGGEEVLQKALALTEGMEAAKAIHRLQEVLEILRLYELDSYISFDLGMLGNYMYYTGVIFRGYTYGVGDAVIKGGRYDNLLGHFGKDAPSIGFAVVVNQLMNALIRQKIEILSEQGRYLMLYRKADRKEAIRKASDYRRQGKYVELRQVSEDQDGQQEADPASGNYIGVIRIGENWK